MSLLTTENVVKRFGSLAANDGISFTAEEGSIHGIIGPNGSGKSTFFNVVTGIYDCDEGRIEFDGTEITDAPTHEIAQQGLCRTFQIPRPFTDQTVRDNLLSVYTGGVRIPEGKQARADEVLDLLEIDHLADYEAGGLSGGQQNLLELARVLMLDPACILLDEPTAGVNPALQNRILGYLREMNRNGTTFVIVEHDMKVIEDITDQVTVFANGQVLVEGSFDEVTGDQRVKDAYLGSGADENITELLS